MKIYLACPYSPVDVSPEFKENVINARVRLVNREAARLMEEGHIVFSPISHSHPISKYCNKEQFDHDFWLAQDLPFLLWADELWVLTLPGWEKSKGVDREIWEAKALGMPVRYLSPNLDHTQEKGDSMEQTKENCAQHADTGYCSIVNKYDKALDDEHICQDCKHFVPLPTIQFIDEKTGNPIPVPQNEPFGPKPGDTYKILDSGKRQDFGTGAVRDTQTGKGRYDLLPFLALEQLAKHFEMGCQKYGDRNWESGIPLSRYFDSAFRHASKFFLGLDDGENHLNALFWNIACLLETKLRIEAGILPEKLNDIPYAMKPKRD